MANKRSAGAQWGIEWGYNRGIQMCVQRSAGTIV